MTTLQKLMEYFGGIYSDIPDHTKNGLQVEGKQEIKKMLFSVSQSAPLFEEAVKRGADAIFVHHGFFGKEYINVTGPMKRKLATLLRADISLIAYHLPLDAHPEHGHNAIMVKEAGLKAIEPLECGFIAENP